MRKFLFFVVRNFANQNFTYIISQHLHEPIHTLGTWLKTSFGAVFCLRGVRLLFVFRSYKYIYYYFFISFLFCYWCDPALGGHYSMEKTNSFALIYCMRNCADSCCFHSCRAVQYFQFYAEISTVSYVV